MTTIYHRICHEIHNKRILPVSMQWSLVSIPLCSSKAATASISSQNYLWCFREFRLPIVAVAALDQHRGTRDHHFLVQYIYYEFHGKSYDLS